MSAPSRPGAPRSSSRASARPGASAKSRPGARRPTAPTTGSVRTSGTRKSQARPGGPSGPGRTAPTAKPRLEPAKARGSWTAMLSWRTAVIGGVVMLAIALIMPSLRVYFEQQQQLQELRAEAAAARTEVDDLQGEVARWQDPSFLVAQARERLAYVFPGETPYRVVDPESVKVDDATADDAAQAPAENQGNTWYDTLWGSMLAAGGADDVETNPEAPPGPAIPDVTPDPEVPAVPESDAGGTVETNVDFSA